MKKVIVTLMCVILLLSAASCGGEARPSDDTASPEITVFPSDAVRTIETTSKGNYSVIVSSYAFDKDDRLISVHQAATYESKDLMEHDRTVLLGTGELFENLTVDGMTIHYDLTEKCLAEYYPDATYDSILENANDSVIDIKEG